jgi:hypothetical protein
MGYAGRHQPGGLLFIRSAGLPRLTQLEHRSSGMAKPAGRRRGGPNDSQAQSRHIFRCRREEISGSFGVGETGFLLVVALHSASKQQDQTGYPAQTALPARSVTAAHGATAGIRGLPHDEKDALRHQEPGRGQEPSPASIACGYHARLYCLCPAAKVPSCTTRAKYGCAGTARRPPAQEEFIDESGLFPDGHPERDGGQDGLRHTLIQGLRAWRFVWHSTRYWEAQP